jgi:sugar phosphate isomerase/epimerase
MKAGLVSITFRELSPGQVIDLAAECGLRGIEWGGDVHVPHGQIEVAEDVRRLTAAAGLEVASYGAYYHFDECDPASGKTGPSMESVLDTAEVLGAPAIRLWPGRSGPGNMAPSVREAIARTARTFAEAAVARGMRIDFEFHGNTLTETPESTLALLRDIGHPAAHTLWQPPLQISHAKRLEGLRMVRAQVSNVHCNYFGQAPWPHVHRLAEGETEWADFLKELGPAPDRWVLIEHVKDHSPVQFREDAEALLRWLALYCK